MNGLPYRFNPKRHKRLIVLSRTKKIILFVHITFLSFFIAAAIFSIMSPEQWHWLLVGGVLSLISGIGLSNVTKAIKKEHR